MTAGTFMHRSHVSLRNWHRALAYDDLAFERDVDAPAPARSGFGELQVGLDAVAQDPAGDRDRRRVSAGRERSGGRDERSASPQELRSAARRAQLQKQADDRRCGRGVQGEQTRARQASRDQGPIRPEAEGVRRKRARSGQMGRDRRLGWLSPTQI